MEKIKLLCALKLINDLMESSSSSDEDEELFAVLCNKEQQKEENIRKDKQSSTKLNESNNQEREIFLENEKMNSSSVNSEFNTALDNNIKQESENFENTFMNSLSETDVSLIIYVCTII